MEKIWIVVADSARARILEASEPEGGKLREIEDLVNPDGRLRNRDLVSAAPGHYAGKGGESPMHAATPRHDPTEHAAEMFAKTLADRLHRARLEHRYDALRLVAPPKLLGLLRKNLDVPTQRMLKSETPKDISWLNMRDVERYIAGLH